MKLELSASCNTAITTVRFKLIQLTDIIEQNSLIFKYKSSYIIHFSENYELVA